MKRKLVTAICVLAICALGTNPCSAQDEAEMVADIVVVRPCCFVATIVGGALFVVSWPIAAMSHSVKKSAHVLVCRPAWSTFGRPLGEMDQMRDSSDD